MTVGILYAHPPSLLLRTIQFHPEYWQNVSQEAKELISALLTVDADKRLTAEQALDNTWIQGDDRTLKKKDLGPNLEELKKFNAKRKFKAAVYGVMASNKLQSLGQDFLKNLS